MERRIYLDNAATTRVHPDVFTAMTPYFCDVYGNASSIHEAGRNAKHALEQARDQAAAALGCVPQEIVFTGCATEADNWALRGVAETKRAKGNHIITTTIEHHAILDTCKAMEKQGFAVTYLPVDGLGRVTPEQVQAAIKPNTILVSIMAANNEIGTVEPIAEIGAVCRGAGVLFHTDAVQAVGHIPVDVNTMNVDLLSLSGHKLYGPKGVGLLYIRKGVRIPPLIYGGGQERKRRAGTENIPGIVGLGMAMEYACSHMEQEAVRLTALRERLVKGVMESIPYARYNGHPQHRLPGNAHFCFEFVEGEALLLMLDMKGISASSGSACTSGSLDPSHVLLAIGQSHEIAHGSLRLTMGEDTTEADVDYVIAVLLGIVQRLREMSPLYDDFVKTGRRPRMAAETIDEGPGHEDM